MLDTSEYCYFCYCLSQRNVATRCGCRGKYDLVGNFLLSLIVKNYKIGQCCLLILTLVH